MTTSWFWLRNSAAKAMNLNRLERLKTTSANKIPETETKKSTVVCMGLEYRSYLSESTALMAYKAGHQTANETHLQCGTSVAPMR